MQKMSDDFERNIKEQTQKLSLTSSVFENATEGITICDQKSIITSVNATFTKITGYTKEEVVGKHISIMKSGKQDKVFYETMWKSILKKGYWEGEITNRRKNGELYDEILHISAIKSEKREISHFIAVFSDISDKRETQESIYNLAHFDSLTKIANRNFFQKKLAMGIKELKIDENIALMYIDLDRFKIINDSLGHNIGDDLLTAVAKRINRLLDGDDFFARLGGDEFAIFFQSNDETKICEQKIVKKADRVIASLNRVFEIEENQLSIGSSIGIALYPRDAGNIEELMQYADTAMYHAKDNGRNRYTIYTGDIAKEAKYRYKIEQELRSAIKEGQITSVYQPIVNSNSTKIEGFEVLSRWIHDELGFISPELFISIAEERGMIADYTYDLLESSCLQIKKWNQKWNQKFYISVNISPVHFLQSDLVENIGKILEKTALSPSLLKLEITEGVIIENKELVVSTLKRFRQMGIKISIDDFGTGYSSISYLKDYPVDFLKIDRSFVIDTPFDVNNKNICTTIVSLAKNFNLAIIAEGVETSDNAKFLKNIGVEYLQGYYFSKPENSEYWDNFLRADAIKKIEKRDLELV
jgi:diguanylate cyclase (GGDEF)-like protein/PAS domain S-box-containing protein